MNPEQFDRLSRLEQETLVCLEGVLVAVRQEPEFIIRLYHYAGLYVELYYHQVQDSAVTVRRLDGAAGLEPYLSNIDLSGLLDH